MKQFFILFLGIHLNLNDFLLHYKLIDMEPNFEGRLIKKDIKNSKKFILITYFHQN